MKPARLRLAFALAAALVLSGPIDAQQTPVAPKDVERVRLIEQVLKSVVEVRSEQMLPPAEEGGKPRRGGTIGSGFFVGPGLVLTASQVVQGAESIVVVTPDRKEQSAIVETTDEQHGFALLKVGVANQSALSFSKRRSLPGESAFIVGWMGTLDAPLALDAMVMGYGSLAFKTKSGLPIQYLVLNANFPDSGFGGAPVVDHSGAVIGMVSSFLGRTPVAVTLVVPSDMLAAAPAVGAKP